MGSDAVRMMGRWKHHGHISTLDHSLFVAYCSYRPPAPCGWMRPPPPVPACCTTCTSTTPGTRRHTPAGSASTTHARPPETRRSSPRSLKRSCNIILSHMWPLGGPASPLLGGLAGGPGGHPVRRPGAGPHLSPRTPAGAAGGPAPPGGGAGCCPLLTAGRPPSRVIPGAAAALRFEVSCPKTRES